MYLGLLQKIVVRSSPKNALMGFKTVRYVHIYAPTQKIHAFSLKIYLNNGAKLFLTTIEISAIFEKGKIEKGTKSLP